MQTINLTKTAAAIRILLGLLFLSTGVMKFAVPDLRAAFSGQLTAAGIPFHPLNMWVVPAAEIGLGVFLTLGSLPRLTNLLAIVLMAVAIYVHFAVNDPALFPLQPEQPIIPVVVIALSISLLLIGSERCRLSLSGRLRLWKASWARYANYSLQRVALWKKHAACRTWTDKAND